jgi:DNA gyrase inhibitor GyrI
LEESDDKEDAMKHSVRRRFIGTAVLVASVLWAAGGAATPQRIEVTVREVEPFSYVCMPVRGDYAAISDAMEELILNMQTQSVFPRGPLIAVFYNVPEETTIDALEWEVGFPVTEQAFVQLPLVRKEWIFTTVAQGVHVGPLDGTGKTVAAMLDWIEDNGYVQNGPILQQYMEEGDPIRMESTGFRTEIWIPCRK